ncbi:hypothetical protein DSOL_1500 [Desulfosporosinus metallidurans]|uniref:Uncharacterized protein n=1 Tax=Desulfosporosinus metallidurans TaxID=1888891 RepID=A0A1Q8QYP9_9FIRM|nr:hypothetical protein DSOL_1500 [Desulfosporosinus metallidurans]
MHDCSGDAVDGTERMKRKVMNNRAFIYRGPFLPKYTIKNKADN